MHCKNGLKIEWSNSRSKQAKPMKDTTGHSTSTQQIFVSRIFYGMKSAYTKLRRVGCDIRDARYQPETKKVSKSTKNSLSKSSKKALNNLLQMVEFH